MSYPRKDIELLDCYIMGMLDDIEKAKVENRILNDEEFRRLWNDLIIIIEGIKRSGSKTTGKEKLYKLEEALENLSKKRNKKK